jgi:hypothetical protein
MNRRGQGGVRSGVEIKILISLEQKRRIYEGRDN